jgi:hypothetical protein
MLFNADFGIACDDTRAVTAECLQRGAQPIVIRRGDDEPRVAHAKRFGEGVND